MSIQYTTISSEQGHPALFFIINKKIPPDRRDIHSYALLITDSFLACMLL